MAKISQQKAGVLLSYINLILGCIVPVFYTPIMLDILGQEEYGLFTLSQSVTSYLSLLNLGLGTAIGRYLAKYRVEGDIKGACRLAGMFITLYSCASVLVCIFGGGLAIFADGFFEKSLSGDEIARMRILILIMTASAAIALPISTYSSVITAYERFVFAKVFAIISTVAVPVANLIILYCGRGSVGMAVFALVFQIITGLIWAIYCSKKLNIVPSFRKMPVHLLKELAGFCVFVVLSMIVDMLYWSTDKVLIGAVLGTVAVAIYNVGGVFTAVMQNMAHAISQVFTPRVMMMANSKEQSMEELSGLLIRIGRLQFYIVSFILSGFFVFGQRFIAIWTGEEYGEAYYVALLTMVPLAVPLIQSVAFSTITAQNKHRFRAVVYAVIAVANVVSTYLVLPHWGIVGAAVCTAVAYALGNGIIMNIYYHRVIKLDIPGFWKNIIRIGIAPLALAIVSWFVGNRVVTVEGMWVFAVGVVVYSLVFWIMNWFVNMNQYEKQLFLGFFRKGSAKT